MEKAALRASILKASELFLSTTLGIPETIAATHTVLLNNTLAFLILSGLLKPVGADAATGCPPTYGGKPLEGFEVFDGPPKHGEPQAPEGNRWTFNPIPASLWPRYKPFYLGCRYRGVTDLLPVELPRNTRICEIRKAPNVQCR